MTRVWFVREDGEYIRPVVDGGGVLFASFHVRFTAAGKPEDSKRFARLFLNPGALGMSPAHYAVVFHTPVEFARVILGDSEWADALKRVAASGDIRLRESACEYLHIYFQQDCK